MPLALHLPIELLSFTGDAKKYGVDLQWKTASEMNNDYFTVSRSATGANFESIGTVKGKEQQIHHIVTRLPITSRFLERTIIN